MGFRPELLESVTGLLAGAKERAKTLKTEADAAARIEKLLETLCFYMANDWPLHVLCLLESISAMLNTNRDQEHQAIQAIEEVHREAREKAELLKRRYPAYLENACQSAGLDMDPESRHPVYSLEKNFFRLKVDERKWIATLYDNEGKLAALPADVGAVVEALLRERKRLFDRPFDGGKFLELLLSHYLAVSKQEKQTEGASIPIRKIINSFEKSVKGYRSDEFLVDLSRLVEQGPMYIDGYQLDLQHTKDINQGILLHGLAGRGYIGFVVFRKV